MWWDDPGRPQITWVRPDFWPDWVPDSCPGCSASWLLEVVHDRQGRVREHSRAHMTFAPCSCPGAEGRPPGHVPVRCEATAGCRTVVWPPEHTAGWVEPAERARLL